MSNFCTVVDVSYPIHHKNHTTHVQITNHVETSLIKHFHLSKILCIQKGKTIWIMTLDYEETAKTKFRAVYWNKCKNPRDKDSENTKTPKR